MSFLSIPLLLILPALLASCVVSDPSGHPTSSSDTQTFRLSKHGGSAIPKSSGPLTHDQAVGLAQAHSPALLAAQAEIRALQGEIVQAGLPPNPELAIEIENFGGSGSTRGFDGAEITTGLSQRIRTAGKLPKQTRLASLEAEAALSELAAAKRKVAIEASTAFTSLIESQNLRALSERNLARAEENLNSLDAMLEAGKSNRIDRNRAQLAVSAAREQLAQARSAERQAAVALSRTWGDGSENVSARGELKAPAGDVAFSANQAIARHPSLRAANLRITSAEASLDLEKARRYPDVDLQAGVRQLRDADETAAIVGLSIPLPLINRNQGAIRAADERIERYRQERRRIESSLRSELNSLSAEFDSARQRFAEFDNRTLDTARQTLSDTNEAYAAGKASLLEVLDARQTLFEIESGRTRALADLLRAHSSLEILTRP